MSDETKAPETNDDRYVKICHRVQQVGEQVREVIFSAVEADDWDTVTDAIEEVRKLDTVYMLAMKRGMQIIEANRPKPTPEQQAADMAAEQAKIDAAFAEQAARNAALSPN